MEKVGARNQSGARFKKKTERNKKGEEGKREKGKRRTKKRGWKRNIIKKKTK